ncbi:MAG: HTTM domain-containing protein [Myxococcota bacterium]|nr:HTTM domain-containing protein [Myxococcota bacterium]
MAKKRRTKGQRPKQSDKPGVTPTPAPVPVAPMAPPIVQLPAREPAFWFGFEVAWAKIAATRFIIFMLLALDAAMQISHAPRYGAGGFNVGQLPFTGALGADRLLYGAGQLVLAYMFVAVAFGVATRVLVPVGAALYAWLYFGSQLDSYQHHYLVALVLVIASFVPWERPSGNDVRPSSPVRSWALRLMLVQLAIMYVWAAVSKMNVAWVDGSTLSLQMKGSIAEMIKSSVGWKVASVLVIATELTLAATIWTRPAWRIAAPLGVLFHLAVAFTGLEIGLFAFLMLGIYALVVPDAFWIAVTKWFEGFAGLLARPSWVVFGIGLVTAIALAKLVRIEDAFVIGVATCVVPLAVAVHAVVRKKTAPVAAVGIAHIVAIALWLFVDRATDVTKDYYRYWGGSQRRLGSPEVAEYAYRRLTEVAPDRESGHYQLGKLLIKRGATEEGLRHLREAQRLEPAIARAFVEEARVLQQQGKPAEAIEKAKQATYADPSHTEARALLDSLTGNKPVKPAPAPTDDDPTD